MTCYTLDRSIPVRALAVAAIAIALSLQGCEDDLRSEQRAFEQRIREECEWSSNLRKGELYYREREIENEYNECMRTIRDRLKERALMNAEGAKAEQDPANVASYQAYLIKAKGYNEALRIVASRSSTPLRLRRRPLMGEDMSFSQWWQKYGKTGIDPFL